jgi:calcineurin-like phosphoesterase family protein
MTLWFTSDEHYGHRNIIEYSKRPFTSVEEMTEVLVERHNARVKVYDTVIHLGDFSLSEKYVAAVMPRLNGSHFLIVGNHDACHPTKKGHAKALNRYRGFFKTIQVSLLRQVGRYYVLLHHMPTRSATVEFDERYVDQRPTMQDLAGCAALIHGHVHEKWAERGRMINVGVDVRGFAPISEDELAAIIDRVTSSGASLAG